MSTARADGRTLLVTGGAGFVGAAVVRTARTRGGFAAVRVLDRVHDPDLPAESIVADACDAAAVRAAMDGVDTVVHAVAAVPLVRDAAAFVRAGPTAARVVADAAHRAGVRRFVLVSSSAVFGIPDRLPVTEYDVPRPIEAYGRAKLAAEAVLCDFSRLGLEVAIVRPRTVLGPGRAGVFSLLFGWIRDGVPVPLLGDGAAPYQFVHVDDLARTIMAACDMPLPAPRPAVLHAAGPDAAPLVVRLQRLIAAAGSRSSLARLPAAPGRVAAQAAAAVGLLPVGAYTLALYGRPLVFDAAHTVAATGVAPLFDDDRGLFEAYTAHLAGVTGASPHRTPLTARADALWRAVAPRIWGPPLP